MNFVTVHCLLMAITSAQQPSLYNHRGIREVSHEQYFMQIECLSIFLDLHSSFFVHCLIQMPQIEKSMLLIQVVR